MARQAVHADNLEQIDASLYQGFTLSRQVMDCTPATMRDYQSRIGNFAKFLYMSYPGIYLKDAQRIHIEHYLVGLRERGRSPWTVRTTYRALKAFYNWLLEEQFIDTSPLMRIKPPKTPKVSKDFLSREQFNSMLYWCPANIFTGARNAAMLWLLWTTGMRLSELAGLKLKSLDWDHSRITVIGKGRKERVVPFLAESKRAVWRYLTYRHDDMPELWITEERLPLRKDGVVSILRRIYERAGIKIKDQTHIFRRTWAYRNLKEGQPIKFVQLIGGWESVTTLEGYVRSMKADDAINSKWV